jgi:hypothetical protein
MASSPNRFVRKTRGFPHRDYNALNNGTPSLLPEPWEGNIREMESPCSPAPSESTGGERRPHPCGPYLFPALRPLR